MARRHNRTGMRDSLLNGGVLQSRPMSMTGNIAHMCTKRGHSTEKTAGSCGREEYRRRQNRRGGKAEHPKVCGASHFTPTQLFPRLTLSVVQQTLKTERLTKIHFFYTNTHNCSFFLFSAFVSTCKNND